MRWSNQTCQSWPRQPAGSTPKCHQHVSVCADKTQHSTAVLHHSRQIMPELRNLKLHHTLAAAAAEAINSNHRGGSQPHSNSHDRVHAGTLGSMLTCPEALLRVSSPSRPHAPPEMRAPPATTGRRPTRPDTCRSKSMRTSEK